MSWRGEDIRFGDREALNRFLAQQEAARVNGGKGASTLEQVHLSIEARQNSQVTSAPTTRNTTKPNSLPNQAFIPKALQNINAGFSSLCSIMSKAFNNCLPAERRISKEFKNLSPKEKTDFTLNLSKEFNKPENKQNKKIIDLLLNEETGVGKEFKNQCDKTLNADNLSFYKDWRDFKKAPTQDKLTALKEKFCIQSGPKSAKQNELIENGTYKRLNLGKATAISFENLDLKDKSAIKNLDNLMIDNKNSTFKFKEYTRRNRENPELINLIDELNNQKPEQNKNSINVLSESLFKKLSNEDKKIVILNLSTEFLKSDDRQNSKIIDLLLDDSSVLGQEFKNLCENGGIADNRSFYKDWRDFKKEPTQPKLDDIKTKYCITKDNLKTREERKKLIHDGKLINININSQTKKQLENLNPNDINAINNLEKFMDGHKDSNFIFKETILKYFENPDAFELS